ncbi:hypothetical protein M440DRAFT_1170934 [Trichoderma longibrachiatum ATCC 18648]|uniref:Uncharacterized protein n=1 Tax=Trichoderma longibrachiatum ATCC 18648 TaxID=983965 RepID=A0A2T4CD82_TRILO|nr:hypothetical protein M440DRAFT_1170934 [Trichoderma longibrachiatum ATCC 18648]
MTTYCVFLPFPLFRQYCRFTHDALELASMDQRASTPWPHLAPRCHVVIHQPVPSPYNSPTHRQIAADTTDTLELESQFLPLDSSLSFVGRISLIPAFRVRGNETQTKRKGLDMRHRSRAWRKGRTKGARDESRRKSQSATMPQGDGCHQICRHVRLARVTGRNKGRIGDLVHPLFPSIPLTGAHGRKSRRI